MRRCILVETAIGMVINALFSTGFAFLVFGGRAEVGLWGPDGLALDFVPQTFAIAMMSVLVPTALTRRRIGGGTLATGGEARPRLPRNLLLRALLMALAAMILLGGTATALLAAAWSGPLNFGAVLPLKIGYGALVALAVTPPALRAALGDRRTREQA
jgi:hypothetical protein